MRKITFKNIFVFVQHIYLWRPLTLIKLSIHTAALLYRYILTKKAFTLFDAATTVCIVKRGEHTCRASLSWFIFSQCSIMLRLICYLQKKWDKFDSLFTKKTWQHFGAFLLIMLVWYRYIPWHVYDRLKGARCWICMFRW